MSNSCERLTGTERCRIKTEMADTLWSEVIKHFAAPAPSSTSVECSYVGQYKNIFFVLNNFDQFPSLLLSINDMEGALGSLPLFFGFWMVCKSEGCSAAQWSVCSHEVSTDLNSSHSIGYCVSFPSLHSTTRATQPQPPTQRRRGRMSSHLDVTVLTIICILRERTLHIVCERREGA